GRRGAAVVGGPGDARSRLANRRGEAGRGRPSVRLFGSFGPRGRHGAALAPAARAGAHGPGGAALGGFAGAPGTGLGSSGAKRRPAARHAAARKERRAPARSPGPLARRGSRRAALEPVAAAERRGAVGYLRGGAASCRSPSV